MESQEIEHFVHAPGGKPRVALAAPEATLREVLIRLEIIREQPDGLYIFVGESVEALTEADEVEDGADQAVTVDIEQTIAVLEIERHRHVHVHPCRHITVEVNFGGKAKKHRFAPNATVGVATEWARRKLHLDKAIAHEYVLQLCGTKVQPRSTEHLGDLVEGKACSLCFDLVKEETPKG
jgi:hypothetical protein